MVLLNYFGYTTCWNKLMVQNKIFMHYNIYEVFSTILTLLDLIKCFNKICGWWDGSWAKFLAANLTSWEKNPGNCYEEREKHTLQVVL